ncbi:hypothetical protein EXM22_12860 [Oceanispirochaeta crateris]|uniref:Uncharacterized protein n=1 Tax=Oceanispirochaeta crateris TaxID=2518645 RepID=A0A5C1QNC2_9SPIO|nr:hypothetical protein [Oceanispirochaeta crateris]QEN08838.1 hypothetical protein EXM22_12860 [Oceanispirochaeta crateris]
MKKALLLLVCLTVVLSANIFADSMKVKTTYGDWKITSTMLSQTDLLAGMTKANIYAPQSGTMVYEFKAKYIDGLADGKGGFGIHVFVDKPSTGKAWGEGESYLLWVNYDENPVSDSTPKGLSAQIYKSESNSRMNLVQSVSLKSVEPMLAKYLGYTLPIKIVIDGKTGMAKVYDPFKANYYYKFPLSSDTPLEGNYIALRTNSMGVAFSQ